MDSLFERRAGTLDYVGPRKALLTCVMFQVFSERPQLPKAFRTWRTRRMRSQLFQRQAALFCFGRKCAAVEDEWAFAFWPDENSPIDVVFRRRKPSGETFYEFVQLKEVVPDDIDPNQSLQSLLDDLPKKYAGITIGIHLNRNLATNLWELRLPASNGESIWLFGAGGEPPQDSFLVGNPLHNPVFYYFNHPRFRPGECVTQWTSNLDDEPSRISKA